MLQPTEPPGHGSCAILGDRLIGPPSCTCKKFFFNLLILERGQERERKTLICCSTYLCIHWLTLVCTLTGDQTHNLGLLGRCSNQLTELPGQGCLALLTPWLSPCPGLLALVLKVAPLFRGRAMSPQAWEQRVAEAWAPPGALSAPK